MKNARKPLFAMIALGAALALPVAFAQDATSATPAPQEPTAAPTQPAPAAEQKPLTWADLDVDGNGTLSKSEAGGLPSLAQVFDDADSDKDGELTPDEYKSFVAKANAQQPDASGGAD